MDDQILRPLELYLQSTPLFFYVVPFKRLAEMDGDGVPPLRARIAGGVSLCAWIGVMAAGRLLTFFKPL